MKQTLIIIILTVLSVWCSLDVHAAISTDADAKAIGVAEAVRELPDSLRTPNRYALVIGAAQYEDKRIPELPAASNDARQLYRILVDPAIGMFPAKNIKLLLDEDVTRINVVDALDSLARRVSKEDLVIVKINGGLVFLGF